MERIDKLISNRPPLLPSDPDDDDAKYTLVMHGLCRKYAVKEPLERHIFSIIENMSRYGRPCLYPPEKLAKYSGGSNSEIAATLQELEGRNIITRTKLKNTNGWKLTDGVRKSATWFKERIDDARKDHRKS